MAKTPTKFLQVIQIGRTLSFKLGNGLEVQFSPDDASDEIRDQGMFHGFGQKIRDKAAGSSKTLDYTGAFTAMQSTADNLMSGLWNATGGGSGIADVVQAVATLKGIEIADAQIIIDGLDDDQMKTLLGKAKLKEELARIKLERATNLAAAAEDDDLGI